VRDLVSSGKKVFLDLKFHDIPNTVAAAVRQASALRVDMLTVHASGGSKMLNAAAGAAGNNVLVLAVTVLTSLADEDLSEIGVAGNVQAQVLRLARLARASGIRGLVASAHEARELRHELGDDFAIVTPGVRPAGAAKGDQARVVTPADALRAGASHIVVGRPISEAPDPAQAAREILRELEGVFQVR
jgi:orotidine-5'-phosphate decarboxylase